MHYIEEEDQWTSEEKIKLTELPPAYTGTISAGTVLVAELSFGKVLFQTLKEIDPDDQYLHCYLIGYEPGSVYFIGFKGAATVPTLRFRDCRFPTAFEYSIYKRKFLI